MTLIKKFSTLFVTILFCCEVFAQAPPATMTEFTEQAKNCQDSKCAEGNVALIDAQIVALLGQRLAFSKRASDLQPLQSPIRDQQYNSAILDVVSSQAGRVGYPPMIARFVFNAILTQTNTWQQVNRRSITNFPHTLPTATPPRVEISY